MQEAEIKRVIDGQRAYFKSGATLDVDFRIQALQKLKSAIIRHMDDICAAIRLDLGKSGFESYMCECGLSLSELNYMIRHTRAFSREKAARTPITQFYARSFQKPSPYGVVLIMSPWNYPFLLSIDPLVDAIAAGNTVVLKPSADSPNTSEVIRRILSECFEERYVAVVTGGREENMQLLEGTFDYIFFTGSKSVGKTVMRRAAETLTPVTLELGGKSPCIVDKTANIRLAARRIVFGKFLNCGQTCVAPDYIYCDASVRDSLIRELKRQILIQFGKDPLRNENYGNIINEKHFNRILKLMDAEKVVIGGTADAAARKIAPTVLDRVTFQDAVMQEEIFGPILPVLTYDSIDAAIEQINAMDHPLALYIFTSDKRTARKVISRCGFGGGCINDTIIQLDTSEMGFGGFGQSGMGAYHGKAGFDTFSHYKSIVDKKTWLDIPARYQPYNKFHNKLVHMFLR